MIISTLPDVSGTEDDRGKDETPKDGTARDVSVLGI